MFDLVKTHFYRLLGLLALITLIPNEAAFAAAATDPAAPAKTPPAGTAAASSEEPKAILHFDQFQVGSKTFTNVSVISRTDTDVFVRHSKGIVNFKASELSQDLQEKLGYAEAKKAEVTPDPNSLAVFARTNAILSELARRMKGGITAESGGDANRFAGGPLANLAMLSQLSSQLPQAVPQAAMVWVSFVLVALPILYFFFCYTARLVCKKAGSEPGFLIWLPIVSLVPLVKAARMPPWTAVLFILPVVNLIVTIFWCFKIAQARGKSILTAICLIFPVTSPVAWLYLAYSK